jgi:hypothetical protein
VSRQVSSWADVDPSSLWAEALDALTDEDEDRYWGPVRELHRRGTVEIFGESMRRASDDDDHQRVLACNVLGQLAFDRGHPFSADSVPVLIGLCADEMPRVAAPAISALGHLGAADAAPAINGLARRHDRQILARVRAKLESDEVGRVVVQAAAYLADASLLEALESLEDWWDVDIELLDRTIDRCDPAVQSAELSLLAEFMDAAERADGSVEGEVALILSNHRDERPAR